MGSIDCGTPEAQSAVLRPLNLPEGEEMVKAGIILYRGVVIMGWGKEVAGRLKMQENQKRSAVQRVLDDRSKIAESADELWQQLTKQLEADVSEFSEHSHKRVDFRAYSVNSNYFVVERPVQPTAKLELLRTPGSHFTVDFSGYSFSGFTGEGTQILGAQKIFRFGLDVNGQPCFIDENGRALSAANISEQAGALLEKFVTDYL